VTLLLDDLSLGPVSPRVNSERRDDGIPNVEELVKHVVGRLEEVVRVSHRLGDLGAPATNPGFDCVGGIHVLDVRGCELEEPTRISSEHLLLVNPPDDLDVLLRHRPRSITPLL
jgi:hypothetical protein